MSTRSLAVLGLVSSVVLGCGGHSSGHSTSATSSDADAGDGSTPRATPNRDASAPHEAAAAADSGATLDAGWPLDGSAPDCPIPDAATSLPGCASLYVACISVAIDCACAPTQYQMLCQPTSTPPGALGCAAQPGGSPEAPAYCCPCGSEDGGAAGGGSGR